MLTLNRSSRNRTDVLNIVLVRIWPDETFILHEDLNNQEWSWLSDDYVDLNIYDTITCLHYISAEIHQTIIAELDGVNTPWI